MTILANLRRLGAQIGPGADPLRRRFYAVRRRFYAQLWAEAAAAVGAEMRALGPYTEIRRRRRLTVLRRSELMLDSEATKALLADKLRTFELLAGYGLPVPPHLAVTEGESPAAERFLAAQPGAVVVKPAAGTGAGRGVTTGIRSPEALRQAMRAAARFCPRLLIEPQVEGASYRLTYLDGDFLQAVRRDPPQVTGDGTSSLRALMAAETAARLAAPPFTALSPLQCDADSAARLAAQGLDPAARPAQGQVVTVKTVVNQNAARENHILPEAAVHPDIREAGAALLRALGIGFAGIDILAPGLDRPLEETGGMVGEINVNPGIHHHHLVADPSAGAPLAQTVLDRLLTGGRGGVVLA
jgi:cyanophycin synthetase